MPKLTDAAIAERRNHILRAAAECFAKNGFRGTTIEDVKRQAGVSTGAIYTYFPNKASMMRALLEGARDERKKRIERAAQGGAGASGQTKLLLEWVAAVFRPKGQHAARVDVNLWAEALRSPTIGKLARSALGEATEAVGRVVTAQLQANGDTEAVDANAAASLIIAVYLGLEVQTAVGMKLDVSGMSRVLAALFADFLPDGEHSIRGAEPTRGQRAAAHRKGRAPGHSR